MFLKRSVGSLVVLLLFSATVFSQSVILKDLGGEKKSNSNSQSNSTSDDETIARTENDFVKLNIGLLSRGVVSLSYERQFLDRFGVEATLGTVMWQDFMQFSFDFFNSNDTVITYDDYSFENEFNSTFKNYYLGGAFRVYTNEQLGGDNYFALYRFFAGLDVRTFQQQYVMESDQFNTAAPDNRFLTVQNYYTGVQLGYMVESDYNALIQEATIGLGLISRSADQLFLETQPTYRFELSPTKHKESKPYFTLGYKIGLKF